MDTRLKNTIDAIKVLSEVQNLDANNPVAHRVSNPVIRRVLTTVAAIGEPYTLTLPLNVVGVVQIGNCDRAQGRLNLAKQPANMQVTASCLGALHSVL